MANEMQRTAMRASISPVAPATVIAANTGPAQGTKTIPMARPTANPPLSRARACNLCARGRNWNGHSSSSCSFGKIIPRPTRTKRAMPSFHKISAGSPSALSKVVAKSVTTVKLVTKPPITSHGRDLEPWDTASTSGRMGNIHGEIPVIRPPIKPMAMVLSMIVQPFSMGYSRIGVCVIRASPQFLGHCLIRSEALERIGLWWC